MVERTIRTIAIPWYRREDWDALRALFVDAAKLPATYEKWLRKAEHAEKQFKRQGAITERVNLDPIEFSLWCADRGTDLNVAARISPPKLSLGSIETRPDSPAVRRDDDYGAMGER